MIYPTDRIAHTMYFGTLVMAETRNSSKEREKGVCV